MKISDEEKNKILEALVFASAAICHNSWSTAAFWIERASKVRLYQEDEKKNPQPLNLSDCEKGTLGVKFNPKVWNGKETEK